MNRKNKKQNSKILIGNKKPMVFVWLIGIFVVIQVFFAVHSASTGAELAQFEKEATELRKRNRTLSDELVKSSSLLKTGENSEDLDYFSPQATLYITNDEFVAQLP